MEIQKFGTNQLKTHTTFSSQGKVRKRAPTYQKDCGK